MHKTMLKKNPFRFLGKIRVFFAEGSQNRSINPSTEMRYQCTRNIRQEKLCADRMSITVLSWLFILLSFMPGVVHLTSSSRDLAGGTICGNITQTSAGAAQERRFRHTRTHREGRTEQKRQRQQRKEVGRMAGKPGAINRPSYIIGTAETATSSVPRGS